MSSYFKSKNANESNFENNNMDPWISRAFFSGVTPLMEKQGKVCTFYSTLYPFCLLPIPIKPPTTIVL